MQIEDEVHDGCRMIIRKYVSFVEGERLTLKKSQHTDKIRKSDQLQEFSKIANCLQSSVMAI